MNNECLVLLHLSAIVTCVVWAKKYGKEALGFIFTLFLLTSNIFITKEMELCYLAVTTCDVYTIGSVLSLNLIQEIYGRKEARTYLYRGILALIVFLIMSLFQTRYIPTVHSEKIHEAFFLIFSHTPRIVISSLLITFVSDRIDMTIFRQLKKRFPEWPFISRFLSSTLISQLLDTILFGILALKGIVENMWHCIGMAYGVKVALILGSSLYFIFTKKEFYKVEKTLP